MYTKDNHGNSFRINYNLEYISPQTLRVKKFRENSLRIGLLKALQTITLFNKGIKQSK